MMKNRITTLVLLLLMFLVAGCNLQSMEEAQVEFCQALTVYGESVQAMQSIDASTTVDELQAARDNLSEARAAVGEAAGDLREAQIRDTEAAWENLENAIDDIPGDATLGEAAATVRGQAIILSTDIDRIWNIHCFHR
jgi:hypothetical protein